MPMTDCTNTEMRDLLPLVACGARGGLPAGIEAHLAGCESCRAELELIEATRRALGRSPALDIGRIASALPSYRPAAIEGDPRVVSIGSRRGLAPAWRIAAAAALVIGAGATTLAVRQAGEPESVTSRTAGVEAVAPSGGASSDAGIASLAGVEPRDSQADSAEGASGSPGSAQMTFGGGLDDLSEDDLVALLAVLDEDDELTPADPDGVFPSLPLDAEEES